jgi:hypothetical protein
LEYRRTTLGPLYKSRSAGTIGTSKLVSSLGEAVITSAAASLDTQSNPNGTERSSASANSLALAARGGGLAPIGSATQKISSVQTVTSRISRLRPSSRAVIKEADETSGGGGGEGAGATAIPNSLPNSLPNSKIRSEKKKVRGRLLSGSKSEVVLRKSVSQTSTKARAKARVHGPVVGALDNIPGSAPSGSGTGNVFERKHVSKRK